MTKKRIYGSSRKKPRAIELVLIFLADGMPHTQADISAAIGRTPGSVSVGIRTHRENGGAPNIRFCGTYIVPRNGAQSPIYQISNEDDEEITDRPMTKNEQKRIARIERMERIASLPGGEEDPGISDERRLEANRDIAANLARLRPLVGNVWGVCAVQVGAM